MTGNDKILGYGRHSIDEDDIANVVDVLRSDFLTQGSVVKKFEDAFAERVGAKYAISCSNGTAALHLACLATELAPGSKGITSTMSFVASANCLLYANFTADLLDIDAQSLNLSSTILEKHLATDDADVIIPIHFAGLASDNKKIRKMAKKSIIIEDACHALGGTYEDGSLIGSAKYADMTVFSFHPVKPITTGEGGIVVTNNSEYARKLRLYRNHGIERDSDLFVNPDPRAVEASPWYYEQQTLGFNYRLTDIQAALGLSQLNKLDKFIERRREIARAYDQAFKKLPIQIPHSKINERNRSGLHLYLIHIDWPKLGTNRSDFMKYLAHHNIGSQVHYIPIHRQPYYAKHYTDKSEMFANAENYYSGCLSIPLFPAMTDEDVSHVIETITSALVGKI